MTMTREHAHWRVDLVTFYPDRRDIPVAWFLRGFQAEAFVREYAEHDPGRSLLIVINENPSPQDKLAVRITEQETWIAEHGGNEAAYIERYGGDGQGFKYGEGGSAIWQADLNELNRLKGLTE